MKLDSHPDAAGGLLRADPRTVSESSTVRYFESAMHLVPGATLPLRSMLVASAREAILISPVGTAEESDAVGSALTTLVAPSLLHHKYLLKAADGLSLREIWTPPGLLQKRPELMEAKVFGVDPWPHGDVLPFVVVEGAPRRNEVVLFHPPTRTIYTADLVLDVLEPEGVLAPLALRAMGVYKRLGMARLWKHWVTDLAAFRRSIEQILAWDFERIAVAHGAIVETHGKQKLFAALRERGLM
jgi:hypothetical protein